MKAWQLLDSPEKWTIGVAAKDDSGKPCPARSNRAVSWCATGAIYRCYGDFNEEMDMLDRLRSRLPSSIGTWNDDSDYATVHAKLKELDI